MLAKFVTHPDNGVEDFSEVDVGNVRLSCAHARDIDLVDYLQRFGIMPVKVRGNNFWYHSPFRIERTPSFKVDRKTNRWYDFGEGVGGSIIDFAIRFKDCTIAEFLQSLDNNDFSFPKHAYAQNTSDDYAASSLTILDDRPLYAFSLINYLARRHIPIGIANNYCRELRYAVGSKTYFAIGFLNRSSGWEIRNAYFKGSSSPKDFTLLHPDRFCICVFEGFIDFLSFLTLIPEAEHTYSFLVLSSLTLFERARPIMEAYSEVWLFLDNDTAGQNYSRYASSLISIYKDQSALYKNHKDLNDWHCHQGKSKMYLNKLLCPP
ncbi:toprim domain-containing protein [Sphingobacterium sp. MYb388]|uniref:toprim domain-containing protein n=1 Tax=Sphingobacterium sp. MYb388 TaxID=2745437 RepID=UPI00309CC2A8